MDLTVFFFYLLYIAHYFTLLLNKFNGMQVFKILDVYFLPLGSHWFPFMSVQNENHLVEIVKLTHELSSGAAQL